MIIRALFKPARGHNESWDDYVVRRAEGNRVIKEHLRRGKRVWDSVKIVILSLNAKGFPVNPMATGDDALVKSKVQIRKRMQGTYRKPQASRTRRGV